MHLFALSSLIGGISTLSLGCFAYWKKRERRELVDKIWFLFNLSAATWCFGSFKFTMVSNVESALFWMRISYVGVILIPVLFFHFVCELVKINRKKILTLFYLFTAICLIANFLNQRLFIGKLSFLFNQFYWIRPPGPLLWIFTIVCFYGLTLYALSELFVSLRRFVGVKRNQIKYVLVGTIIGFSGGFTCFLPCFGLDIYPYGNFTIPVYPIVITYAIVAYRLMDINVIITRGLAYGTITAAIAGTYVALMVGVDKFFGGVPGYNPALAHSLLFIVVLFALIYVLPRMKIRAIELTRRALFRGKYDYQQELSEAARLIPTMLSLERLGDYVLTKIRDTVIVDKLALLIFDENKHTYDVLTSLGLNKKAISKIKIGENSALAGLLREESKPLVKEELERTGTVPAEAMGLAIEQLNVLGAELCVPLLLKDDLAGIVTLSNKKSGEMYTDEDLSLLAALANQVALTIEYIKAIDKISSEKRYVGLGKAAMRMAHDIKNPLVPLKTFLQILPDKYPKEFKDMSKIDKEFTGRFYESALEGVDRINLLIERALHFARHPEPAFAELELHNLLDDVLMQEEVELKEGKVQLEKQYSSSVNSLEADGEQLVELFSNLVANSIDAMEQAPQKKLTIKTQALSDRVAVEIIDTGCGIAKDKVGTIFDPFITYKHQGSGLGLAIAKKIVDDHHGTIEVNSEQGKGSSFRVTLPRKRG